MATIYGRGLMRRRFALCPYGCGRVIRAWTKRRVLLELHRHTAVCRWNRTWS
jgi:hypothetical protein